MSSPKIKEKDLLKLVIDYLSIKKVFHYRQNSGALKTDRGGFVRFGTLGAPDLVIVVKGLYIGCELKVGKNYQSPTQKQFQKDLELAGGLYWLVYSLDDVIKKLNSLILSIEEKYE